MEALKIQNNKLIERNKELEEKNKKLQEIVDSMKENVLVESLNSMKDEYNSLNKTWEKRMEGIKYIRKTLVEHAWRMGMCADTTKNIMMENDEIQYNTFSLFESALESYTEFMDGDYIWLMSCVNQKCGGCSSFFCSMKK